MKVWCVQDNLINFIFIVLKCSLRETVDSSSLGNIKSRLVLRVHINIKVRKWMIHKETKPNNWFRFYLIDHLKLLLLFFYFISLMILIIIKLFRPMWNLLLLWSNHLFNMTLNLILRYPNILFYYLFTIFNFFIVKNFILFIFIKIKN